MPNLRRTVVRKPKLRTVIRVSDINQNIKGDVIVSIKGGSGEISAIDSQVPSVGYKINALKVSGVYWNSINW